MRNPIAHFFAIAALSITWSAAAAPPGDNLVVEGIREVLKRHESG